ncbi:hypothetical protein RCH33_2322 [Flavobacterium daejeonense]|nr:hypothetical protein RCH33_2322 [Flavobacterium daejeonense]
MKKLAWLFLIICYQISGQTLQEAYQKESFDWGISCLSNNKNEIALKSFYFAHQIFPNNDLSKLAIRKCDSLKPIVREKHKKNIIGNWKKIYKGANWIIPENDLVGEMITINKNEILFFELYKNAKEWCLVKTEPIVFCEKAEQGNEIYEVTLTEFTFKNKDVWQFYIDEKSGLLKTFLFGNESENGLSQIICGGISEEYFKLE